MDERGEGEYHDFPSKTFCFAVPKISLKNPSVVRFRKLPVAKKFMDRRGEGGLSSKFSVENFLSQKAERNGQGKLFVLSFRKFPVAKKFLGKTGGEYQGFPSKIFCLSTEKFRRGTLLCCVSENFR